MYITFGSFRVYDERESQCGWVLEINVCNKIMLVQYSVQSADC